MSSIRATIGEAHICLDRSRTADEPVVRDVMLKKAARLIARVEVMLDIKVESMPDVFTDAIIYKRENPSPAPIVVARAPLMDREAFIRWKKTQDPTWEPGKQ